MEERWPPPLEMHTILFNMSRNGVKADAAFFLTVDCIAQERVRSMCLPFPYRLTRISLPSVNQSTGLNLCGTERLYGFWHRSGSFSATLQPAFHSQLQPFPHAAVAVCPRACGILFFILLFPWPCGKAQGCCYGRICTGLSGSPKTLPLQAVEGERHLRARWKLSKTLGNVTGSPLRPVPGETMRETVLQSSGRGLATARGCSGSLCLLPHTAKGHHNKARLKQNALRVRGKGLQAEFSLKIIC